MVRFVDDEATAEGVVALQ
ncbi:unnamed protein product [Amaranthus hypochondriacus]